MGLNKNNLCDSCLNRDMCQYIPQIEGFLCMKACPSHIDKEVDIYYNSKCLLENKIELDCEIEESHSETINNKTVLVIDKIKLLGISINENTL